jgi:hypothetical protein
MTHLCLSNFTKWKSKKAVPCGLACEGKRPMLEVGSKTLRIAVLSAFRLDKFWQANGFQFIPIPHIGNSDWEQQQIPELEAQIGESSP